MSGEQIERIVWGYLSNHCHHLIALTALRMFSYCLLFVAGEYTFDDEPDSSLFLSGKWQDGKGGLNAVVGGTGKYARIAGGEGKYKVDEDHENWNIVKITLYE